MTYVLTWIINLV